MLTLRIRIEPVFLEGLSVGTITPIKVLREHLGMSLAEAKRCIDRCVFDAEVVDIEVESAALAESVAAHLRATAPPPKVHADVIVGGLRKH